MNILIFLLKFFFPPIYGNNFCDAGQVPTLRYFEAWPTCMHGKHQCIKNHDLSLYYIHMFEFLCLIIEHSVDHDEKLQNAEFNLGQVPFTGFHYRKGSLF